MKNNFFFNQSYNNAKRRRADGADIGELLQSARYLAYTYARTTWSPSNAYVAVYKKTNNTDAHFAGHVTRIVGSLGLQPVETVYDRQHEAVLLYFAGTEQARRAFAVIKEGIEQTAPAVMRGEKRFADGGTQDATATGSNLLVEETNKAKEAFKETTTDKIKDMAESDPDLFIGKGTEEKRNDFLYSLSKDTAFNTLFNMPENIELSPYYNELSDIATHRVTDSLIKTVDQATKDYYNAGGDPQDAIAYSQALTDAINELFYNSVDYTLVDIQKQILANMPTPKVGGGGGASAGDIVNDKTKSLDTSSVTTKTDGDASTTAEVPHELVETVIGLLKNKTVEQPEKKNLGDDKNAYQVSDDERDDTADGGELPPAPSGTATGQPQAPAAAEKKTDAASATFLGMEQDTFSKLCVSAIAILLLVLILKK